MASDHRSCIGSHICHSPCRNNHPMHHRKGTWAGLRCSRMLDSRHNSQAVVQYGNSHCRQGVHNLQMAGLPCNSLDNFHCSQKCIAEVLGSEVEDCNSSHCSRGDRMCIHSRQVGSSLDSHRCNHTRRWLESGEASVGLVLSYSSHCIQYLRSCTRLTLQDSNRDNFHHTRTGR